MTAANPASIGMKSVSKEHASRSVKRCQAMHAPASGDLFLAAVKAAERQT
jgi:hypothetical protein